MFLVCYNAEQDALRIYLCGPGCWEDMYDIYALKRERTSFQMLLDWDWEVVGEL